MSLDINKVIMEATATIFERQNIRDDKGAKPITPSDKDSYHAPVDVKPPTNTLSEARGEEAYVPSPGDVKPVPKGSYVPSGAEEETAVQTAVRKGKKAVEEAGEKVKETAGKAKEAAQEVAGKVAKALKDPAIASGATAAAIAAGLGAVALAKKLRKAKKATARARA